MMLSTPNTTIQGRGFYVSYNDVDTDSALYGGVTTALVQGQMEHFLILNGDHRAAYRDLMSQGWEVCLAYFRDHLSEKNHRSEELPSMGGE